MHSGCKCVYVMSTTAESRLFEVLETKYIISNYQEVDIKLYNPRTWLLAVVVFSLSNISFERVIPMEIL